MPGTEKVLAFPVYPGVTPLDLIGPLTVLNAPGIGGTRYRTVVVGERAEPLATDTPLLLQPAATFAEVPNPWAVVVPGGGAATLAATEDEALLSYVRSAAPGAQVVGSTGNGALVLAAADLLRGKRAAIHWAFREPLEKLGGIPATERWLVDGRLQTAAGGTAGIDMALPLLARLRGKAVARLSQCPRSTTRSRRSAGWSRTLPTTSLPGRCATPTAPPPPVAAEATSGKSPSCSIRG
jgi:transcriptional regulator GlxA family with amidase domain